MPIKQPYDAALANDQSIGNAMEVVFNSNEFLLGNVVKGMQVLAGVFVLIWTIIQVRNSLLDNKPISSKEVLNLAGLLLLLSLYGVIYEFVKGFFDTLFDYISDKNSSYANLTNLYKSVAVPTESKSIFSIDVATAFYELMMSMLKFFDSGLNWGFSIYIEICLYVVKLFGPVAIVFSIVFKGEMLKNWLMMFFKYLFYSFVLTLAIGSANQFLILLFRPVADSNVASGAIFGGSLAFPSVTVLVFIEVLIAYIIFKLVFTLLAFKIVDNLFSSSGTGLGGMVAGAAAIARKAAGSPV